MSLHPSTDPKTGGVLSVYVQISDARVARTVPAGAAKDPSMLIDLDKDGQVVGVEVLSAEFLRKVCNAMVPRIPAPYQDQVREACARR